MMECSQFNAPKSVTLATKQRRQQALPRNIDQVAVAAQVQTQIANSGGRLPSRLVRPENFLHVVFLSQLSTEI